MRKAVTYALFAIFLILMLAACSDFQLPNPADLLPPAVPSGEEAQSAGGEEIAPDQESAPAEGAVTAAEEPTPDAGQETPETEGAPPAGDETPPAGETADQPEAAPAVPPSSVCPEQTFPMPEPAYENKRQIELRPFAGELLALTPARTAELDGLLLEASVADIQALFDAGTLSAEELATYYIQRISLKDINRLNSVLELNPEALNIARNLDAERAASGPRGMLHGIPILLKDNIATGDSLHTAAGAAALAGWQAERDAFLVARLRDAGAVILGKANLSEWANYMDSCMPNGFSALGGQTRNPYGPFDPLGSSSGSAVSVAANLIPLAVGTETSGSIIQPARVNGVVAIKTSRGLVSRDNIIPLAEWLDVPGPIGRSVADVAQLLTAMTGVDENDPATAAAAELAGTDFTQFLTLDAVQGLKVGVIGAFEASEAKAIADMEEQEGRDLTDEEKALVTQQLKDIFRYFNGIDQDELMSYLNQIGVEVVEIEFSEITESVDVAQTFPYAFNNDFNAFMAGLGDQPPVASLADVVAFNEQDLPNRAPYGQRLLQGAVDSPMTAKGYEGLVADLTAQSNAIKDAILTGYDVDVVVAGLNYFGFTPSGAPAMTLPAGLDENGQPKGIILTGDLYSEPQLISLAYALEQTIGDGRVSPDLDTTLAAIEEITHGQKEETPTPENSASVTGNITYTEGSALPEDAVITVSIEDISLADAPATLMGEQIIESKGAQVPIPYEVAYNPEEIIENNTYRVAARIEDSAGQLLFISDTVIPVITGENPTSDVEILVVPSEAAPPVEGGAAVSGNVTYTEGGDLPEDAVITVRLEDVSRADAPAIEIGQQVIESKGAQVPIPYEIAYNPEEIIENNTYRVAARIEDSAGQLLFISDTIIPVITRDNPTSDVEILVVPTKAAPPVGSATAVTGTVTYLQRSALPENAIVTVRIQDVSLADAEAVLIGEQIIETNGAQVPISFEVTYNPEDIIENHTYAISARIEDSAGVLFFINDTVIPVITNGYPTSDVEILVVPYAYG